jgi:hypothetical protein
MTPRVAAGVSKCDAAGQRARGPNAQGLASAQADGALQRAHNLVSVTDPAGITHIIRTRTEMLGYTSPSQRIDGRSCPTRHPGAMVSRSTQYWPGLFGVIGINGGK